MTNYEKYKTAKERAAAFVLYAEKNETPNTGIVFSAFRWLDLEAPADVLPCPVCGCECVSDKTGTDTPIVHCENCLYMVGSVLWSEKECIERHNRVARALEFAKKENEI